MLLTKFDLLLLIVLFVYNVRCIQVFEDNSDDVTTAVSTMLKVSSTSSPTSDNSYNNETINSSNVTIIIDSSKTNNENLNLNETKLIDPLLATVKTIVTLGKNPRNQKGATE